MLELLYGKLSSYSQYQVIANHWCLLKKLYKVWLYHTLTAVMASFTAKSEKLQQVQNVAANLLS